MDKTVAENDRIVVKEYDIVKLNNNMIAYVNPIMHQYNDRDVHGNPIKRGIDTPITITISPISSICSTCFLKHIFEVIQTDNTFETALDYLIKNELYKQPLTINLV